MQTPAEELGLLSRQVGGRVRSALLGIAPERMRDVVHWIDEDARAARLIYLHHGRAEAVSILPAPLTVLPQQEAYLHTTALTLHDATRRLLELWLVDPDVRAALPVPHGDEEWIRHCWTPLHARSNPVFGRLDAVVLLESAQWKSTLQFLEPNLTGIGGLHMLPTSERILEQRLGPLLRQWDPTLRLTLGQDIRELLAGQMLEHLEALGRPGRRLCFIEPRWAEDGPEEQTLLAEHLHRRLGVEVCHADPSELVLDGEEVLFHGQAVDLAYRDYSVEELRGLSQVGVDVSPMRALLAQNRMVSSIAAELEQKACGRCSPILRWSAGTSPPASDRSSAATFRGRGSSAARRTELADGSVGDLPEFVRSERELLVLKPNRGYGGTGVCIGAERTQGAWECALEQAMAQPDGWVAQQRIQVPVHAFPVLAPDGGVHLEPFYVVLGLAPTEEGLSLTARASQELVVNVARRGGLAVVMVAHPDFLDSH